MAADDKDKEKKSLDVEPEEAEDIEHLLAEQARKEQEEFEQATFFRKAFLWLSANRETVFKYTAMTAGLILVFWAGYFFLFTLGGSLDEADLTTKAPEEEILPFEKPNIYALKPFFLPITSRNGTETGQFLQVQISLLLSNNKLDQELEKALPNLRSGIYQQLSRKTLEDFENAKKPIKVRLKREILTMSNSFLVRGSGVITNVLFTEFVVTVS
ncbi:flagellar basal body-associated FliL family protein [Nitrospina watsonii]|uniref:Flagellar protein FliL n=1 Tax=Nitrospina watsonii TaxID=1323948 RepID=A0ABM9HE09_9BACT|nr:flagellar basal body-associated FliL family protein [Nitrospina watsonii]CAI2718299.1 Flagellar protein FliL [Nitrospina watsonii]